MLILLHLHAERKSNVIYTHDILNILFKNLLRLLKCFMILPMHKKSLTTISLFYFYFQILTSTLINTLTVQKKIVSILSLKYKGKQ